MCVRSVVLFGGVVRGGLVWHQYNTILAVGSGVVPIWYRVVPVLYWFCTG